MTAPAERLRQFYVRFGSQRFAEMGEFFTDDVWYMQLNYMTARNSPHGPAAVTAAYTNWGTWFRDLAIRGLAITPQDEAEVVRVGGARYSFEVQYLFAGRYVQAIPGLRVDLTVGRPVQLLVTDRIWMDGRQRINRVVSSFKPVSTGSSV